MLMKTMTKLASISLCALLLAAAACGDKKPPKPPTTSTDGGDTTSEEGGTTASDGDGGTTSAEGGATATKEPPKKDCHKDMFGKYKQEGFAKVVDSIIAKSVAAPEDKIGKSFKKVAKDKKAAEKLKTNLLAFLVKVYGGEDKYKGKDMPAAHKGMKITSDQYDYFVKEIVVPSLKENGVSEEDITGCFAPPITDEAFKSSIVEPAGAAPPEKKPGGKPKK
jgi:hemoglobin